MPHFNHRYEHAFFARPTQLVLAYLNCGYPHYTSVQKAWQLTYSPALKYSSHRPHCELVELVDRHRTTLQRSPRSVSRTTPEYLPRSSTLAAVTAETIETVKHH